MIYSLLLLNHASWHYPALIIHFWGNFLPIQFSGGKDAATLLKEGDTRLPRLNEFVSSREYQLGERFLFIARKGEKLSGRDKISTRSIQLQSL
jgi:hypothetical protein